MNGIHVSMYAFVYFFCFFNLYIDQHVTHIADYVSQSICHLINEPREYFLWYILPIFRVVGRGRLFIVRASRIVRVAHVRRRAPAAGLWRRKAPAAAAEEAEEGSGISGGGGGGGRLW